MGGINEDTGNNKLKCLILKKQIRIFLPFLSLFQGLNFKVMSL